jgi:hypothetical protein
MNKIRKLLAGLFALVVSAFTCSAAEDVAGLVSDVTGAITAGQGYVMSILTVAVTILAVFIGWKLLKRGASKV